MSLTSTDLPNLVDQATDHATLETYLQAELERLRQDPLKYGHACHAMQEEWLSSRNRRKIIVAGNRSGKTEAKMKDVLWMARGHHPYRPVNRCFNIWVGSPDYPSYLRFHKPAFDQWCPPDWIVGKFHESEKFVDIRHIDGGKCRIFFLSYDMPRSKWQGAGVDHIWLDEECPEDILAECLARIVTTRGSIDLSFTPVSGVGWWFDRIWVPAQEGLNSWEAFQMPLATFDPANEDEYNVGESLVPHLTRDQIVEFASEYPDPDERAIRIFGDVRGRQGLVYKQYRPGVHKISAFDIPANFDLWGGLDPGYHGFAALIGAMDPMDRTYIAKEFFSQQETTRERFEGLVKAVRSVRSQEIWDKEPQHTVVFFVDTEDPQVVLELNIQSAAHAEAHRQEDGSLIRLVFASLDQGLKARKAGFMRVQQCLAPRLNRPRPPVVERDTPPVGEPLLYFFDNLYSEWQEEDGYHRASRTLWEINHYSWKPPPKDKIVKPDDADENSAAGAHAMAALRYLVMARLGPPQQADERDDPFEGDRHSRNVWDEVREMEARQLEEAGYT